MGVVERVKHTVSVGLWEEGFLYSPNFNKSAKFLCNNNISGLYTNWIHPVCLFSYLFFKWRTVPFANLSNNSTFTFSLGVHFLFNIFASATRSVLLLSLISSHSSQERPKSALERLYSGDKPQRAKMSADEQLERMKRHQKALVRQRKRTLSHGDRQPSSWTRSPSSRPLSADLGSVCY